MPYRMGPGGLQWYNDPMLQLQNAYDTHIGPGGPIDIGPGGDRRDNLYAGVNPNVITGMYGAGYEQPQKWATNTLPSGYGGYGTPFVGATLPAGHGGLGDPIIPEEFYADDDSPGPGGQADLYVPPDDPRLTGGADPRGPGYTPLPPVVPSVEPPSPTQEELFETWYDTVAQSYWGQSAKEALWHSWTAGGQPQAASTIPQIEGWYAADTEPDPSPVIDDPLEVVVEGTEEDPYEGTDPVINTTGVDTPALDEGDEALVFQPPVTPGLDVLPEHRQLLWKMLTGDVNVPFLDPILEHSRNRQAREMDEARAALSTRGILNSTPGLSELTNLGAAQDAANASMALQALGVVSPQMIGAMGQTYGQDMGVRDRAYMEFTDMMARQTALDAQRDQATNEALTLLLSALGFTAPGATMPSASISGGAPSFLESIGNIFGNL
jgi:hypothetical protein